MLEVKIVADSPALLAQLVAEMHAALSGAASLSPYPSALTGEEGIKVGRAVEKNAQRKAQAAEPKVEKLPEEKAVEPIAEETPAVAYTDVQAAVTKLAANKGRDAVVKVFDQFGVDHGSKLTEAQWGEAIAALADALEG